MLNSKVLEMLENGQIEELKAALQDEIYQETLKNRPSAKKRYAAMKKYFTYVKQSREVLQKPCPIIFEGKNYTCFTNSWSLVLTSEPTGEIELFDKEKGNYPDVTRLINFDGVKGKIDFNKVIAEASSKGYKLTKTEIGPGFKYLMMYDGTYYKIGLIDISLRIIDCGTEAMTYHPYGERKPLTITTDLGICVVMPVFIHNKDELDENAIVIEVND